MYFAALNLLRAFAAFTVILYHVIVLLPWDGFAHQGPLVWFRLGWMGVDVFFVISGFVIALSALSLVAQHPPLQARRLFMRRRLARIAPLYLLSGVFFVLVVQPELLQQPDFTANAATHLLFIHNLFPQWHGAINGPSWSIAAEMQFYLLICLLMPWLAKRSPLQILALFLPVAWLLRGAVALIGPQQELIPHHMFIFATQMPMMLDLFGFGIALACWLKQPNRYVHPLWFLGVGTLAFAAAFYLLMLYPGYWQQPLMVMFWRTLFGIGVVGMLALLALWKPRPSMLFRIGHYLGDISYGLYLWHMPVLLLLKQQALFTSDPVHFCLAVCGITTLLAAVSWHLLEQPIIRRYR